MGGKHNLKRVQVQHVRGWPGTEAKPAALVNMILNEFNYYWQCMGIEADLNVITAHNVKLNTLQLSGLLRHHPQFRVCQVVSLLRGEN